MKRRFNFRAAKKTYLNSSYLKQENDIIEKSNQSCDLSLRYIYRFRPIDKVLGSNFQELKKQEIYFSQLQDLKDPTEGLLNIFWQGDYIVWQNLFNHYLLSATYMTTMAILSPYDNIKDFRQDIPLELDPKELFPTEYIDLFTNIQKRFFQHRDIKNLLQYLSEKNSATNESELSTIFSIINHSITFKIIFALLQEKGIFKNELLNQYLSIFDNHIKKIITLSKIQTNDNEATSTKNQVARELNQLSEATHAQLTLLEPAYENIFPNKMNLQFLLFDFTFQYLQRIPEFIHKSYYVASFLPSCKNINAWSYYADKHTGICLKFKTYTQNCQTTLLLKGKKHLLHKVEYDNQTINTNFFLSLMNLTGSELENYWYKDKHGQTSQCFEELIKNIKNNTLQQRNIYQRTAITKPSYLNEEKEYRLILNENSLDLSNKQDRKLKYRFQDLDAIIFGLHKSTNDKNQVIQIIKQKCYENERTNFDFYQTKYNETSKKLFLEKLNI